MKPVKGDKVSFWLTVLGKPTLITGLLQGYSPYNGRGIVRTENGFTHYIKPEKLTVLKENRQIELELE